jgi:hypothetical protein
MSADQTGGERLASTCCSIYPATSACYSMTNTCYHVFVPLHLPSAGMFYHTATLFCLQNMISFGLGATGGLVATYLGKMD